jgi:hypothetical protein
MVKMAASIQDLLERGHAQDRSTLMQDALVRGRAHDRSLTVYSPGRSPRERENPTEDGVPDACLSPDRKKSNYGAPTEDGHGAQGV